MFIVLLEFSANRSEAQRHMPGHNAWLQRGFDDGVFLASGSLEPGPGGGILATGRSLAAVERLVAEDPFVVYDVVRPTIIQLGVTRAVPSLDFLID